jgi:histidinol-phosphate phosphatase family protein
MKIDKNSINKSWTLFLDRDGVINRQIKGDYVRDISRFEWLPGSQEAITGLSRLFGRIIIVTNQQGIGKGLMTKADLDDIHQYLQNNIKAAGGKIDKIYYCPYLSTENQPCRKPDIGMALQAKADFPDINFEKSIMVGDSVSDMEFGKNAGMKTAMIHENGAFNGTVKVDWEFNDLFSFYQYCLSVGN